MPRKDSKPQPPDDIGRLKQAARQLLARLEQALQEENEGPDEEQRQHTHERIFGKASLASTLVTLAELMLKLEGSDSSMQEPCGVASWAAGDVALVEAFVRRVKEGE